MTNVVETSVGTNAITVTEENRSVSVTNNNYTVEVNNLAVPAQSNVDASAITITPYNTITSDNLQDALEELADQDFRSSSVPTGNTVEEGDTWYNTSTDIWYVYRTIDGVADWRPIVTTTVADKLDGGAF